MKDILGHLIIYFVILSLAFVATYYAIENYSFEKANKFLKNKVDALNQENYEFKRVSETDKNLYKKGNDIYINQCQTPLKRVLNMTELKNLKDKGYE